MSVKPYGAEPADDTVIWRFVDLRKFRDLMASEELYFRRADLFTDKSEGLPPEQYAMRVLGLDPYDINDRVALNNHLGSLAQHRESYYVSCWHLFRQEELAMWEQYGHDGVAIVSSYGRLRAALGTLIDEAQLGLIRYGVAHLANTFNALEFITTKQLFYEPERELRAWLTVYDPLAGGNRHFDLNNFPHPAPLEMNPRHSWVPEFTRRRVQLSSLIAEAVISPWAESDAEEEIKLWVDLKKVPALLRNSDLAGTHTPTLEEFRAQRGIISAPDDLDVPATAHEIQQFYDTLAALTPSRVRFLYKQRWEVCRMAPGRTPRLSDLQYLETTVRVLGDFRRKGIDIG